MVVGVGGWRKRIQARQAQQPDGRMTGGRLTGLDGVRGLAVLLVVLSHNQVPLFGPGGIEGVTTFFTLSGFLITGLLLKEFRVTGRIDLLAFWGRRALRLLPALFTFVGLVSVVFWATGWGTRASVVAWVKPVLLYYSNFQTIHGRSLGPFRHTWSLAVEEQFYLVWPLLLLPLLVLLRGRRRARSWLLWGMSLLTVVSLYWRLRVGLSGPEGFWVRLAPHTTVFSMTAGACLAVVYERTWRPGRWAPAVAFLGLTAYFWLPVLAPRYAGWIWGPLIYTGIALVLLLSTTGTRRTVFNWRPLRSLGTVSYGWYLWHYPFMSVATHLFTGSALTVALWSGMVLSLLVAAGSWRYLERPLQRRFRARLERVRLSSAPRADAPAVSPSARTDAVEEDLLDTAAGAVAAPGAAPELPVREADRVIDLTAADLDREAPVTGA
ncbi:MAG TPA: acyltransferase [Kineosporiaceae bacterium]|nr:acyltransferase [Kineosporiaceae bacterium]